MKDILKMYVWLSIFIFICFVIIFLASPESFIIG